METEYIKYIPAESRFYTKNGFLMYAAESGDVRVTLHRAFPFDAPDDYISVKDTEETELGIIKHLAELDADSRAAVEGELSVKYYAPRIVKIKSLKEVHGFSYWQTECENGTENFTVKDTYRSIMKLEGGKRLIISDIDGVRREVRDVSTFDAASLKKLELYL